jgi:C_GCAxxG_C_C family probable redox protein
MKKIINRRDFIVLGPAVAGSIFLGNCTPKGDNTKADSVIEEPDAMSISKSMPKDQVFKLLDQKVNHYMELSHHCAQSSFLALSEQFGLGNDDMVKALSPIPGIADRGETCGAVSGALLALGLVFGKNNISDWQGYRDSLKPANEFCDRFEQELGSLRCRNIVKSEFGMELDLRKEDDLQKFREADAAHTCSKVVRTAVRIAADLILEA